jgi:2-polyprenyl-3-methyl-5-hydroxy-6-metoxy-1,4-benzoquinol methylase
MNRTPYITCPLCNSAFSFLREDATLEAYNFLPADLKKIRWVKCNTCNHIFTDGYLSPTALNALVSIIMPEALKEKDLEYQRLLFSKLLDLVVPFKNSGRWLDVGCAKGFLLAVAKEYGFQAVGIDLSPSKIEALKLLHIDAYNTDLEHFEESGFDVVSFLDVLEHLPFPAKALKLAHTKMNPGSILVVSMPNAESTLWDFMNSNSANPYWGNVEHCHNFTRTNLYSLLRSNGFEPKLFSLNDRYRCSMQVISSLT